MKKGDGLNPLRTYGREFEQTPNRPYEMLNGNSVTSVEEEKRRRRISGQMPFPFAFPRNFLSPEDSQTVNLQVAFVVAATTNLEIMRFIAPDGATTFFTGYAIIAGASPALPGFFTPKVNSARILPFHGNPNNKFRLDTATLGDSTPINLQLQPRDILTWEFNNTSGDPVTAIVEIIGYVDMSTERLPGRHGG